MLSILCPITSRNCPPELVTQPIFHALLPSLPLACGDLPARLVIGYDSDDPLWSLPESRSAVGGFPIQWVELHALGGNLTAIWNQLAAAVTSQYILPANDDLEFLASIHPAIDALRLCGGFGVSAFDDEAFPGLPTFYVAHRTHFEIFGTLYPLPWRGAHQDSWIADVYRPWKASEINRAVKCRNHVGVGSRFDYGGLDGYTEAVMRGRRRANEWCKQHDDTAHVLTDLDLESAPTIIQEAAA